jgi:hypothetical protein
VDAVAAAMITPRPVVITAAFIGYLNAFVRGVTAGATGGIAGAVVVLARRSVYDLPTILICLLSPGHSVSRENTRARSPRVCCRGRSSSTLCVKNRDRDEYDQSTAPSSSGSASAESPSSEMATCFRATSM